METAELELGRAYLVNHGTTEYLTLVRIEQGRLKFLDSDNSGVWVNNSDIICMGEKA